VTLPPDFDQLVGADVDSVERQRLRRMHSLLVQAGPPAELSPALESGPTLGMTINRRPRRHRRRLVLLAAAIAVLGLAFLGGYISGNTRGNTASAEVLKLGGTPAAPHALASLQVEPVDAAGNWPMHLSVEGLPKLKSGWEYEVYLMRGGKPWGSCGSFKVATDGATTVDLNAPYRLKHGDSWVVTRQPVSDAEPGTVVLRPA
jgi:Anti-sigma-K factor rskA